MGDKIKFEELLKDTGNRVDTWLELAENVFKFASNSKNKFKIGTL